MKFKFLIPLIIFFVISGFLLKGLFLNPREVPSPLVGKPAPQFELAQLHEPEQRFSRDDMLGKVWLLNVWASWCVSCKYEHPVLMQLARTGQVRLYGLNYKDERTAAMRWLREDGNPYTLSVMDTEGRVGIDYGVYGVPETYVIDKKGVIRHKHTGPVYQDALDKTILPLVRQLENEA